MHRFIAAKAQSYKGLQANTIGTDMSIAFDYKTKAIDEGSGNNFK